MHTSNIDPRAWEFIAPPGSAEQSSNSSGDGTFNTFIDHHTAPVLSTEVTIATALRKAYPNAHITNVPSYTLSTTTPVDLLAFASAGRATATPDVGADGKATVLHDRNFRPPLKRLDGSGGGQMVDNVWFGKYKYEWQGRTWLLFYVRCRELPGYPPDMKVHFLLSGEGVKFGDDTMADGLEETPEEMQESDDQLIRAGTMFTNELLSAIWVFNSGYWQQDGELYKSIMKSSWDDVILDQSQKKLLQADVDRFFDSQGRYERLRVPWKRGVIYYGPPGNGKTISIKATMHTMYQRIDPIPTLYVRSLSAFGGPEFAIRAIFTKARQTAPCLLVFEDLDSLVTPSVRSYFLNEVDGLAANDGIMMIGSTNHLELLDPGISKRPSRFDRKFLFDKPNLKQRTQYAEFWRRKLTKSSKNQFHADTEKLAQQVEELSLGGGDDYPDIEFPKELSPKIAGITQGFSFAYMQEAFIASLLTIAAEHDGHDGKKACKCGYCQSQDGDELEDLRLWREIKKQVMALREEM